MNPVQYVPLQKKCFDTVTVSIMLDSGTPVPFLAGKRWWFWNFVEPYTIIFIYKSAADRMDASFYVTTMKRKVYCCDGARDLYEEYSSVTVGGLA